MEITAEAKAIKVSTRKVRLVADSIRNKSVRDALHVLAVTNKHGVYPIRKVLQSAVANGKHNAKVATDTLIIAKLEIGEGPFLKRYHASTRGRIRPYKKRTSHIKVVLTEKKEEVK